MYKVPFRAVYTDTFKQWVKSTLWCLFVIKIWPHLINLDEATDEELKDKNEFLYQWDFLFREVQAKRAGLPPPADTLPAHRGNP